MKKNMGTADKLIRLMVAAIIVVLYFMGILSGTLGIVFLVIAAVFAVTSFVSFCPLYVPFGFSTAPKQKK
jgi:uncharacterized membrane protein